MTNPLVSVLMPVYNAEKYLQKSVASVLEQSFADFELIAFNDGSTDTTEAILKSFNDNRLKVLVSRTNRGYTNGLNESLAVALGKYIARMDADDLCDPNRLKAQVGFLEHHPEVTVLGTCYSAIDENDKLLHHTDLPLSHEMILWELLFTNPVCHPSVMIRRDALLECGGWDEKKVPSEDYDLWLRMIRKYRFENLPGRMLRYRVHASSVTASRKQAQFDQACESLMTFLSEKFDESISIEEVKFLLRNVKADYQPAKINFSLVGALLEKHFLSIQSQGEDPSLENRFVDELKILIRHQFKLDPLGALKNVFRIVKLKLQP
jgi:glycosyltransferase involved in cell wall biosynthesis